MFTTHLKLTSKKIHFIKLHVQQKALVAELVAASVSGACLLTRRLIVQTPTRTKVFTRKKLNEVLKVRRLFSKRVMITSRLLPRGLGYLTTRAQCVTSAVPKSGDLQIWGAGGSGNSQNWILQFETNP